MTKIVYNACYGGFGLSHEAVMRYAELKGITLYQYVEHNLYSYYLCPPEEYEKIRAEEAKGSVREHRYAKSNAMYFSPSDIPRNDPILVQVVEELGEAANGPHAKLVIEELAPGTLYRIDEYDGYESVATQDSYDWSVA